MPRTDPSHVHYDRPDPLLGAKPASDGVSTGTPPKKRLSCLLLFASSAAMALGGFELGHQVVGLAVILLVFMIYALRTNATIVWDERRSRGRRRVVVRFARGEQPSEHGPSSKDEAVD